MSDPIDPENLDKARVVEGSELSNMFLVEIDGKTKPVKNTAKNELLYKHGLYEFLYGENTERKILSDKNPYIAIRPHHEDEYKVWFEDEDMPVVVPADKSERLLRGIGEYLEEGRHSRIKSVYREILDNQVRRKVINMLSVIYPQKEVVTTSEGWIVRGLFKVTWDTGVYIVSKDLDEGSYRAAGDTVRKIDTPQDFLTLKENYEPDSKEIKAGDKTYLLTDLEMEFISKVEYLLEFEKNVNDPALLSVIRRQVRDEINYADEA